MTTTLAVGSLAIDAPAGECRYRSVAERAEPEEPPTNSASVRLETSARSARVVVKRNWSQRERYKAHMMRFTMANESLSLILSHSSISVGEGSSTSGKKSYKEHVRTRS